MTFSRSRNPYLYGLSIDFVAAYSKRKNMEKNFNNSMLDEYTAVNERVAHIAGELIKCGIEVYQEEDDLSFIIDGEKYSVPLDEICQVMSDEDFKVLMSGLRKKDILAAEADEEVREVDVLNSADEAEEESVAAEQALSDELQSISVAEENPQISALKETESSLIDDLINIQRKVLKYEHEKSVIQLTQMVEQCKAEISEKEESINSKDIEIEKLVIEIDKHNKDKEEFEQKIQSLVDEKERAVSELKDEILRVNNDLKDAQRKIKESGDIIEDKNRECESLEKRLANARETLEKYNKDGEGFKAKIDGIRAKLEEKSSEADSLNAKIRKLENEKEDSSRELNKIKGELSSVQKKLEDAKRKSGEEFEKELEHVRKELTSVRSELGNTKNELSAARLKVKNLEKTVNDKDAELKRVQSIPIVDEASAKKIDDLTTENDRLRHELERVKNQPSPEQSRKSDAVYEEKIAMLQKLAYTDEKCNVKNSNAFNVDYPKTDKDKITVSMVGICNMKIFNNTFGRAKGDIVIIKVAQMLKEAFSTSDIYRIMGDQFTIISENADIQNIKSKLQEIEDALEKEMINIVFGCVDGVTCKDHETTLKQAESAMKQMKSRSGKASITRKNLAEIEKAKEEHKAQSSAKEDDDEPIELPSVDEVANSLSDDDDEPSKDDDKDIVINSDNNDDDDDESDLYEELLDGIEDDDD